MPADEVANTIKTIAKVYKDNRQENNDEFERFGDFVQRVGIAPFKTAVYG